MCLLFVCDELIPCSYQYSISDGHFDIVRVDTAGDEDSTAMASLSTAAAAAGGGAAAAAPSTAAATWAPGAHVTLSSTYTQHGDAASGPLKPSEVATVVSTEAEGCTILVQTAEGRQVILLRSSFAM